jgi:hypothetical protein
MNSTGGGRTTRPGNLLAALHDDDDKILHSKSEQPQDKTLMSPERALDGHS